MVISKAKIDNQDIAQSIEKGISKAITNSCLYLLGYGVVILILISLIYPDVLKSLGIIKIINAVIPPTSNRLEDGVATPNLAPDEAAFLDVIAYAEGTLEKKGYQKLFGGSYFTGNQHPNKCISFEWNGKTDCSTAAGRYQILNTNTKDMTDFSPKSQDQWAISKLKDEDAWKKVKGGNIAGAIYKVCNVWASLPCFAGDLDGHYQQPVKPVNVLLKKYRERYNLYANLDKSPLNKGKTEFIYPVKAQITSGFGYRIHPITKLRKMHKGIDFGAAYGTPVVAAAEGVVVFSGWDDGGYGNKVILQHNDGKFTLYAHNSTLLVTRGQMVKQGKPIALVGNSGRSTGAHLHFEVILADGSKVNPMLFLPK